MLEKENNIIANGFDGALYTMVYYGYKVNNHP